MKIIIVSALAAVFTFASNSEACSYYINKTNKGNELAVQALNKLGVSIEKVNTIAVRDLKFWESRPTSMCPEEMTYTTTIQVSYTKERLNAPVLTCAATVDVKKVEPWGANRGQDTYEVTVTDGPTCTL